MFKILHRKVSQSDGYYIWLPVLIESGKTPLPSYVVVNTRYMADMTEEEWIEQYKQLNNDPKGEYEFRDLV